jgi:hypothetical protein
MSENVTPVKVIAEATKEVVEEDVRAGQNILSDQEL